MRQSHLSRTTRSPPTSTTATSEPSGSHRQPEDPSASTRYQLEAQQSEQRLREQLAYDCIGKREQTGFANVSNAFVAPVLIIFVALTGTSGKLPIRAHSSEVIALAAIVVLLGAYRRRKIEDALDRMDDLETT